MSKAALVMDMPDSCVSCYMYRFHGCTAKRYQHIPSGTIKPTWCPLRPLPSAKKERAGDSILILGHKKGFNDCLEAIGGMQNE